jgi:hypothetical protein
MGLELWKKSNNHLENRRFFQESRQFFDSYVFQIPKTYNY